MIYYIYLIILGIATTCSLLSMRWRKDHSTEIIAILLGASLLTEILAGYCLGLLRLSSNYPVYTTFLLFQYILYTLYFRSIYLSPKNRRIAAYLTLLLPLIWAYTTFRIFGIMGWNSYFIMIGDTFTVLMSACYFYEVFTSDDLIDLKTSREFWIAAGIFIYSCCELPITGILNYLANNYPVLTMDLYNVLQSLNILMLLIFIYAFLCPLLTNTTKSS